MSPGWTRKVLVDVGGLEPPTPCLQIQKAKSEAEAENEWKLHDGLGLA
jgi:hypothetical protein